MPVHHIGGRKSRSDDIAGLPADVAFLVANGHEPARLAAAVRRAARLDVEPADVLITAGDITETAYYRRLADHLGLSFVGPDRVVSHTGAKIFAVEDLKRIRLAEIGHTALGRLVAVAPHGIGVRRLAELVADNPEMRHFLRIAPVSAIRAGLVDAFGSALTGAALGALANRYPSMSARAVAGWRGPAALAFGMLIGVISWQWSPMATALAVNIALTLPFLAIVSMRLAAALAWHAPMAPERISGDANLPVYSVLVPLYREAGMVPGLITALRRLDYPAEKLDIKLIVEADDGQTRSAIEALDLGAPFETVVVPPSRPRTKPKALSFALPLARGTYIVVYDAEDRPDADQLRIALAAFRRGGRRLGCVQARLVVDPPNGHFLARQFTAEYAGLFFVFLPFLARLAAPLPLGGTSNHFRREVLEKIGGWDPYNVTEDADIGIRLARFGFRAGVIASATREEPPARLGDWLKQRTRWFKGWMQTWSVHMRQPGQMLDALGWRGFLLFQLTIGGQVLSALIHPVFLLIVAATLPDFVDTLLAAGPLGLLLLGINGFNLLAGYAGGIALALVGLRHRDAGTLAWHLVWLPLYWVLMSLAAYRAAWQYWAAPALWEKTPHGLTPPERGPPSGHVSAHPDRRP